MEYYYYDYVNSPQIELEDDKSTNYSGDDYDYFMYSLNDSWGTIYQNCIVPSSVQIIKYLIILIFGSLTNHILKYSAMRLCPYYYLKSDILHFISLGCGLLVIYLIVRSWIWLITIFISLLAYALILILKFYSGLYQQQIGMSVAILLILIQLGCEAGLLNYSKNDWQNIRGIQMLANMKSISFAFDFATKNTKSQILLQLPNIWAYLGYIFCPNSCVLGPWIPYHLYDNKHRLHNTKDKSWLVQTVLNIILALAFLNLSNCLIPALKLRCAKWLWLWLRIYLEALCVRCSHYFICFLSQATLIIDVGSTDIWSDKNFSKMNSGTFTMKKLFGAKITQPLCIEFPRSLYNVVRNWNIPMHHWLKKYIFQQMLLAYGSYLTSLLFTYVISALLHGFHTKVHSVLFSLAIFTYVEKRLRTTLSRVFDACIGVRCDLKTCPYTYCPNRNNRTSLGFNGTFITNILIVKFVNILFSLLTIVNLAYLGVIMNEDDVNLNINSKYDGLWKWHQLNYLGHVIHFIMFTFQLLI